MFKNGHQTKLYHRENVEDINKILQICLTGKMLEWSSYFIPSKGDIFGGINMISTVTYNEFVSEL